MGKYLEVERAKAHLSEYRTLHNCKSLPQRRPTKSHTYTHTQDSNMLILMLFKESLQNLTTCSVGQRQTIA